MSCTVILYVLSSKKKNNNCFPLFGLYVWILYAYPISYIYIYIYIYIVYLYNCYIYFNLFLYSLMFLLTAHYYCPAKEIEMRQKEEKPVALKAKKGKHYYLTKFIHVNKTCHSIIYCICCLPILPILPPPPPLLLTSH